MRGHLPLILNWFEARGTISAGTVEGKNYQVKLAMKNAYGFLHLPSGGNGVIS